MQPIYSQFGQLTGWLSGNVIYGAGNTGLFFVRDDSVFNKSGYIGKLRYANRQFVLMR